MQEQLKFWQVDAYVCEDPTNIFYLAGIHLSSGLLLIDRKNVTLFVDGRYTEAAQKTAACTAQKREDASLFAPCYWKGIETVGFDVNASYLSVATLKKRLKAAQKRSEGFPSIKLKPLDRPILRLREIKDRYELERIKRSAELLWKGFLHAKKKLRVGIKEKEIAWEFELYCRKQGAESLSFPPIVAFGSGSALPHYQTGGKKLSQGDIVLMDLGVCLDDYASDMTRTLFFKGGGSKQLQTLYQVVEEAKEAALALCRPGTPLHKLDQAARKVMLKAGLEELFIHRLGHGVGLDVHEFPDLSLKKATLKEGMVITIEPGLYLPGKGGVRLEDMVIITKTGHQNLFV